MYIIISFTILFAIMGIIAITLEEGAIVGFFKGLFVGALCGAFMGGILSVILSFLLLPFESESDKVREQHYYPIVSIKDTQGIQGSFFLGSGYINSKMVYIAYHKTGDASFKMLQIDAENSTINYSDGEPHMTIRLHTYKNNWKYKISIESFIELFDRIQIVDGYDFYIPKGSIKEGFAL